MVEIKRVTENERTSEFINVEFTNYAIEALKKSVGWLTGKMR